VILSITVHKKKLAADPAIRESWFFSCYSHSLHISSGTLIMPMC